MIDDSSDSVASLVLATYNRLKFRPPDGQFTILAGFVLRTPDELKVISLGTGSKCLPEERLPPNGDALHDSHAEVLARRGAIRWCLEEIGRVCSRELQYNSPWIKRQQDGTYALRSNVSVVMYISTVPCGDASTRYLASFQDAEMAALKDSVQRQAMPPTAASRGRDNYSLYGVMRTKPGRADSPPTLCMSCSDKLATWNVLGIQGALGAQLMSPVYIDRIIIGEVAPPMRDMVLADCQRALYGRLRTINGLSPPYKLSEPQIEFTSIPFTHSRYNIEAASASGSNDSLCWISGSPRESEVLINGCRRGVSPKHRHNAKFRPILSKLSLLELFVKVAAKAGNSTPSTESYYQLKRRASGYQAAKAALRGHGGPFEGWVVSGERWERFNIQGSLQESAWNGVNTHAA